MTYTLNIPDGPNNPSQDQPLMKANTNAIDALISSDHITFNNGVQTGYHNIIHQKNRTTNPPTVAGINQVYSKDYTPDATNGVTDTQLFTKTGLGNVFQVTGFVTAGGGNAGYCWIGGALLQWGIVNFTAGLDRTSGTVTFKDRNAGLTMIPFPNNCFAVTNMFFSNGSASSNASNTIGVVSLSKTAFSWSFSGSVSNSTTFWPGFYWMAIGN